MQWRIAEEKCANELLQSQLDEIQVTFIAIPIHGMKPKSLTKKQLQEKLNTHIHVCVYAESFTADSETETEDWKTVDNYR